MSAPTTPTTSGIGKSAERLLAQLAARNTAANGEAAPAATPSGDAGDAEVLLAADLAVRRPNGGLKITQTGQAHLARLAFARSGAQIDPFLSVLRAMRSRPQMGVSALPSTRLKVRSHGSRAARGATDGR
jgi:hypothetical protein